MSGMQISSDVASIVKQGLGAKGVAAFQKMERAVHGDAGTNALIVGEKTFDKSRMSLTILC